MATIKEGGGSHVLICLNVMTGFVGTTFVAAINSETIKQAAFFTAFFITHGLPNKLIIINSGNEFAGTALQVMCSSIGQHWLACHSILWAEATTAKQYCAKDTTATSTKFSTYMQQTAKHFKSFLLGTIFAVYTWNAAPVDS
jgi:hypothetical protein